MALSTPEDHIDQAEQLTLLSPEELTKLRRSVSSQPPARRTAPSALRSYGVEMSVEEASLYRRRFFESYPGLKRWHDHVRRSWHCGDTETRTLTGRRRMDVEKLTDRLNAPVQGTATDGLKLALAFLWERRYECPGAMPVLVCHDEVVVECTAEQAVDTKAWLEKAMIEGMNAILRSAGDVRVSVEVEDRIARSWREGG